MRALLMIAIVLSAGFSVTTAPAAGPTTAPVSLKCTVAVPERGVIQLGAEHSPLHVVLQNLSDQPIDLADEWNSWGYFSLTLRCTTADGRQTQVTKAGRDWTKNFLTTTTLQPGEMLVRDVVFDSKVWSGLPTAGKVTVTAVFKPEEAGESKSSTKLWTGTAESAAVSFEIRE